MSKWRRIMNQNKVLTLPMVKEVIDKINLMKYIKLIKASILENTNILEGLTNYL